jgi:hypothetical protein
MTKPNPHGGREPYPTIDDFMVVGDSTKPHKQFSVVYEVYKDFDGRLEYVDGKWTGYTNHIDIAEQLRQIWISLVDLQPMSVMVAKQYIVVKYELTDEHAATIAKRYFEWVGTR